MYVCIYVYTYTHILQIHVSVRKAWRGGLYVSGIRVCVTWKRVADRKSLGKLLFPYIHTRWLRYDKWNFILKRESHKLQLDWKIFARKLLQYNYINIATSSFVIDLTILINRTFADSLCSLIHYPRQCDERTLITIKRSSDRWMNWNNKKKEAHC